MAGTGDGLLKPWLCSSMPNASCLFESLQSLCDFSLLLIHCLSYLSDRAFFCLLNIKELYGTRYQKSSLFLLPTSNKNSRRTKKTRPTL